MRDGGQCDYHSYTLDSQLSLTSRNDTRATTQSVRNINAQAYEGKCRDRCQLRPVTHTVVLTSLPTGHTYSRIYRHIYRDSPSYHDNYGASTIIKVQSYTQICNRSTTKAYLDHGQEPKYLSHVASLCNRSSHRFDVLLRETNIIRLRRMRLHQKQ